MSTNPQRRQSIIAFAIEFEAGVSELPKASPRRKIVYGGERVAESIQMIKEKVPCVTKIMQETRYGRHKPSPKRCHLKQGSLQTTHSWGRSSTEGKRDAVTPLLELHFVTLSIPKCHRKIFSQPTSEKTKTMPRGYQNEYEFVAETNKNSAPRPIAREGQQISEDHVF